MVLITESAEDVFFEPVITEQAGEKQKTYKIQGIFLQAERPNRNNRVYPVDILEKEVNRYTNSHIITKRALGELGHPQGPSINLERVSHRITKLVKDGNNFIGEAILMDTPYGKIAKEFIDSGVQLGVSSRGTGTLSSRGRGINEVGSDFMLATPADIVADPSAPDAFVEGIMEGKEWVWANGALVEKDVSEIKDQIEASVRQNNLTEGRIVAMESFFNKLKNSSPF